MIVINNPKSRDGQLLYQLLWRLKRRNHSLSQDEVITGTDDIYNVGCPSGWSRPQLCRINVIATENRNLNRMSYVIWQLIPVGMREMHHISRHKAHFDLYTVGLLYFMLVAKTLRGFRVGQ